MKLQLGFGNLCYRTIALALLVAAARIAHSADILDTPRNPLAESAEAPNIGFVVLAPDRGFLGNEETRDAFDLFDRTRNAQLVFVTDERTRSTFSAALDAVKKGGATEIIVLPLFLSSSDSRFVLAKEILDDLNRLSPCCVTRSELAAKENKPLICPTTGKPVPLPKVARPFGESYFAVEVLSDHFRTIHQPKGRRIVVVGSGAKDAESRAKMEGHWQRIASKAAEGFGFDSVRVVVDYEASLPNYGDFEAEIRQALADAAKGGERPAIVPFHLGKKLDSMMTFNGKLRALIPAGAELVSAEITPHPTVALWMEREANRWTPFRREDLGVVFLAHGSDYHWNETMRESVQSLTDKYKLEFAFSMADKPIVERAVRRLEDRGATKIVIVRVFGLASSFKSSVEKMIGLDVEHSGPAHADTSHNRSQYAQRGNASSAGDSHGHGHSAGPTPRIRSAALIATAGGLEDNALFASALLDRVRALSTDPARETLILAAHGSGDDKVNEHWRGLLNSIAQKMRVAGGDQFNAIHAATWREDWPDKREPEIASVRQIIEEASREGRRVIVVPARTTSEGFEKKFLAGLNFELASGFAPHPLFAKWIEEQIDAGTAAIKRSTTEKAQHEQHASVAE